MSSLPNNWQLLQLGEIGRWFGGGTPSKANPKFWTGGNIPWVSPKDMKRDLISDAQDHITQDAVVNSATNLVKAGSVLVVVRSGILVHTLPVAIAEREVALNQDLKAVLPREGVSSRYLALALKAFERDILHTCAKSGTTVQNLEIPLFLRFKIPIAPPEEQKQIVAEIEKQFTRLEAGVAGLRRVQANLKRYRAAVLKAACEGKLVPTEACLRQAEHGRQAELARQEGRTLPAPRPGGFFIYAIRCDNDSIYIGQTQDLQKRWQEHLAGHAADWTSQHKPVLIVHYEEYSSREEAVAREKWLKTGFGRKWLRREIAAGRLPADAAGARQAGYETGAQLLDRILTERRQKWNGKGKYKEPTNPDTTNLPMLPDGWIWASVEQISTKVVDGVHKKPAYVSSGVPFVTVRNLTYGPGISFEKLNYVTRKDHLEFVKRANPESGDILVSKDGTLGVIRVVRSDIEFSIFVSVALVKPVLKRMSSFIETALSSPQVQVQMVPKGSGLQHIHLEDLRADCVPLPPLAEQHRIVAEVERRLSVVEELETVVNANLHRAKRLRQSILQRAFNGELWSPCI